MSVECCKVKQVQMICKFHVPIELSALHVERPSVVSNTEHQQTRPFPTQMTVHTRGILFLVLLQVLCETAITAFPLPQQMADLNSNASQTTALSPADSNAAETARAKSGAGISNAELVGYAAAGWFLDLNSMLSDIQFDKEFSLTGIAVLAAIAVGGVLYNRRRKRRMASKEDSEAMKREGPSDDASVNSRDSHSPSIKNRMSESPLVGRNLAGRGQAANARSHIRRTNPEQEVEKGERKQNQDSESDEEGRPSRPRGARRSRRKPKIIPKRQEVSESSDTGTDSSTDESVRSKRR